MTLISFKTPFKKYVTWKGENMVDEKAGEKRDNVCHWFTRSNNGCLIMSHYAKKMDFYLAFPRQFVNLGIFH